MDHKEPGQDQPQHLFNNVIDAPDSLENRAPAEFGAASEPKRDRSAEDVVRDDVQQMLYGLLPTANTPAQHSDKPRTSADQGISYLHDTGSYMQLPSLVCSSARSIVVTGNAAEVLRYMPETSVQSCITSPPYWSLRDYGISGQIGLEQKVSEYVSNLVAIFERVRGVMRDDGTFWLNIGDSCTSGGRTWRAPDRKNPVRAMDVRPATPEGLKPKDLIGVPWRLAFALQDAGWFLRADIVWNKPNCQPESVRDRPTRSHEYLSSAPELRA